MNSEPNSWNGNEHLRLPELITEEPEEEVDDFDLFLSELSPEQRRRLDREGFTLSDAFEGNVPGIDPDELIERALTSDADYDNCRNA